MSVNPSPIGGYAAQFFDNNGVILSGGKIYTYAAGTTTPQATYTSAAGTTPHSNPIVLDSAGRVPGGEIWLTDGLVYKFVIETSNGILIGSYDNITGVNSNFVNYTVQEEVITATAGQTVFNLSTINYTPGTNSLTVYIDGVNQYVGTSYLETDSNTVTFTSGVHVGAEVKFTTAIQSTTGAVNADIVAYDPPFTGGVATNVQDKLEQYVSVKDFGAVGDGVTDDTAAFTAALAASDYVGVPAGTYLVTGNIDIKNKSLMGDAANASIIKLDGSNTNDSVFVNGGNIATPWGTGAGCTLQNLSVEGNWDGVTLNTETNISNIGGLVKWWSGSYVNIKNCNFYNGFGFGVFSYRLGYSEVTSCRVFTCAKNGIHFEAPNGTDAITSTTINNCSVNSIRGSGSTGGSCVYLQNAFSCTQTGCVLEDAVNGVTIEGNDNRNISLINNHIEFTTGYCVNYNGNGLNCLFLNNVFATAPVLFQANPATSTYAAINNFLLPDVYTLPQLTAATNEVILDNANPKRTINSIALTPGTWQVTAAWIGTVSTGVGQLSARQEFALNTSAAIPSYSSTFALSTVRGDCVSSANTADGFLNGSCSLNITVTANTTLYLYGGGASISGTLEVACSGWIKATKVNGPY